MTQELFDTIVNKYKELFNFKLAFTNTSSYDENDNNNMMEMYKCLSEYFKKQKEIIDFFDTINIDWCKDYHKDYNSNNKDGKLPEIYMLFRKYLDSLYDEEYLKCKIYKDEIFLKF